MPGFPTGLGTQGPEVGVALRQQNEQVKQLRWDWREGGNQG